MDSKRRIDLLGLDKQANLVVIELKRTEDGGHMELQAIRYAAMVSTLTADKTVEIYGRHLRSREKDADPRSEILKFLEWDELDEERFAQDVRIILVSAEFSKELTTAVIWLNEGELDIRCVRIKPYQDNGRILIDVQQVIPLPEAADYQVQLKEKKRQEKKTKGSNADFTRYDININGESHQRLWKRNAILLIAKHLCNRGVSPEEIGHALHWREKRLWLSVVGELDAEEFMSLATADAARQGGTFDRRRWHCGNDDALIRAGGRTYALSNQWGKRWQEAMDILKATFPQLEFEYRPTGS